jgi:predicted aspartyl protease
MKRYSFTISDDTNLIIVMATINGYEVRLALDTGASDTVIDLTALLIAGYRKSHVLDEIELETAKGIIRADIFQAKELKALGLVKRIFLWIVKFVLI